MSIDMSWYIILIIHSPQTSFRSGRLILPPFNTPVHSGIINTSDLTKSFFQVDHHRLIPPLPFVYCAHYYCMMEVSLLPKLILDTVIICVKIT
jgi:hypothetical protein